MKASNLTLTGSTQYDDLNGSNPSVGIIFDGITLYPSPYIVFTEKQYTKHYYIGSEKIATMIGDGGIVLETNYLSNEQRSLINDGFYRTFEPTAFQYDKTPNIDIQGMHTYQLEYECGCIEQVDLYLISVNPMLEPMMTMWQNSNGCTNEIYYTHSNHLGSASWITDVKGNPIQYIHYAPYGELIANQQTIGYDERFKFTGKERDWETGYDYFGARFYDHRKGFWNSVDPLADKYPNVTPYLYCNGNPIMLVDPDGRETQNWMNPTTDPELYENAEQFRLLYDNNNYTINIVAHGGKFYILTADGSKIRSARQFEEYLNEHSELWRTTENKSELSIVLYSCNTGRLKGLFLNIAQKIAKRLKVKVYAPSETLLPNPDCPGCFVVQRTWKKRGRTVTRKISKNLGFWTEFSKRTHKRIPRSAQAFKIDDMKIILQRSESSPK